MNSRFITSYKSRPLSQTRSKNYKSNTEQQHGIKAKKIVLPNFDAAKKRLQLLDSQRKQSTTAFVPEQPVRSHRFPTDGNTSGIPDNRRTIDQYVGYAEKIQLRGKPETTTAKVNASVIKEDPLKNLKTPEKQSSLSDKLLMEMSKELKYLRTAMDTKLANISWAHNSQTTPVRTDLLQRLAGMSISKKLSVMIANHFTNHS